MLGTTYPIGLQRVNLATFTTFSCASITFFKLFFSSFIDVGYVCNIEPCFKTIPTILRQNIVKSCSTNPPLPYMPLNITARLDYCNSILYGFPKSLIQPIQNTASRLVTHTNHDHRTLVLKSLVLPVHHPQGTADFVNLSESLQSIVFCFNKRSSSFCCYSRTKQSMAARNHIYLS